jgi:hypothetical protein
MCRYQRFFARLRSRFVVVGALVHVFGTLESACDFDGAGLYCIFEFVTKGSYWTVSSGQSRGQTHTVEAVVRCF